MSKIAVSLVITDTMIKPPGQSSSGSQNTFEGIIRQIPDQIIYISNILFPAEGHSSKGMSPNYYKVNKKPDTINWVLRILYLFAVHSIHAYIYIAIVAFVLIFLNCGSASAKSIQQLIDSL